MPVHTAPPFTVVDAAAAVAIAAFLILLVSLLAEPTRRRAMAIFVAGAGAAYLNGGFGGWEFAYIALATYVAYRGLESYRFIGIAWLMHTAWDIAHHVYGEPIVAFDPSSSAGCAVTDTLIALWFLAGAPGVFERLRSSLAGSR